MKTFGEFFDQITRWAEESGIGLLFLHDWPGTFPPNEREAIRTSMLSEERFCLFAEDAADHFRENLSRICTDALYTRTIEEGHTFLEEAVRIGRECGLTLRLEDVDTPLTPTEFLLWLQKP